MKNSKIEWCEHTFNPWSSKGAKRVRTSEKYWRQPLAWDRNDERARVAALHSWPAGKPMPWHRPRVFCASMADWLDEEVPIEWLADMLDLIRKTPNLDWILLTKRPKNWKDRLEAASKWVAGTDLYGKKYGELWRWINRWIGNCGAGDQCPPFNVWIGTSVENQATADERIPRLLEIPARVRFLSCEPLLGHVDILLDGECSSWKCDACGSKEVIADMMDKYGKFWVCPDCGETGDGETTWNSDIHWVIAGGESGPHARPMHPEWARSLRDQCAAAGVPFFFKQWGEWEVATDNNARLHGYGGHVMPDTGEKYTWLAHDGTTSNPNAKGSYCYAMAKVGKKAAGRELDGNQHLDFPSQ